MLFMGVSQLAVSHMPICVVTFLKAAAKLHIPVLGMNGNTLAPSERDPTVLAPALVLFSQLPKLHCADLTAEGYRNIRTSGRAEPLPRKKEGGRRSDRQPQGSPQGFHVLYQGYEARSLSKDWIQARLGHIKISQ